MKGGLKMKTYFGFTILGFLLNFFVWYNNIRNFRKIYLTRRENESIN